MTSQPDDVRGAQRSPPTVDKSKKEANVDLTSGATLTLLAKNYRYVKKQQPGHITDVQKHSGDSHQATDDSKVDPNDLFTRDRRRHRRLDFNINEDHRQRLNET